MDMNFDADSTEIEYSGGRQIELNVRKADFHQILDQIGREAVIDYFGIEEAE